MWRSLVARVVRDDEVLQVEAGLAGEDQGLRAGVVGGGRHQPWYSGSGSTFENTVGAQIGLVQQGLASPEDALSAAHDQLTTYANTKSPL